MLHVVQDVELVQAAQLVAPNVVCVNKKKKLLLRAAIFIINNKLHV